MWKFDVVEQDLYTPLNPNISFGRGSCLAGIFPNVMLLCRATKRNTVSERLFDEFSFVIYHSDGETVIDIFDHDDECG